VSDEALDLVKRLYAGLPVDLAQEGQLEAWADLLKPVLAPGFQAGDPTGEIVGFTMGSLDEFIDLWRDWLSAWETWWVDAEEFVAGPEGNVVVLLEVRARSKTDRVEIPFYGANVLTIEDSRLTRLHVHFDRAKALADAGIAD
jgi:hypothetical protein